MRKTRFRNLLTVATAATLGLGTAFTLGSPAATAATAAGDAQQVTIAQIQGTGETSPLDGQTVTTTGYVTASYPAGGFRGFVIQTPGSGGGDAAAQQGSQAVFVYYSDAASTPAVGTCVTVTGRVSEYHAKIGKTTDPNSLTELSAKKGAVADAGKCDAPKPVTLSAAPGTDVQREKLESMLVQPTGNWTVTDNYNLNRYGQFSVAFGKTPLFSGSDVALPGEAANNVEAQNKLRELLVDDGQSTDYSRHMDTKLPYIAEAGTLRVGARATFEKPMIMDYRYGNFALQPTSPQVGVEASPVSFQQQRPANPIELTGKGGDIKIGTFNVLNYFTNLGQDEDKCKAYVDREGNGLTGNRCKKSRGAYTPAALANQESKIVSAINGLGADIVGLEEIENGSLFGTDRDASLAHLVTALNKAAPTLEWKMVASPDNVPNNGDAIRTAFIYKANRVKPVGPSVISDDHAFDGIARSPLAQKWSPIVKDDQTATDFVVITNHFKSKGSLLKGAENADKGDGQGNNNGARLKMSQALISFTKQFAADPTFLVGDFNAYTKEDPVRYIQEHGFELKQAEDDYSFLFGGRVGSLDHFFVNPAAADVLLDYKTWDINASEPVALEYSRANTNLSNLFEAGTPYRSSDHNPLVALLDVVKDAPEPAPEATPEPSPEATPSAPQYIQQVNAETPVNEPFNDVTADTLFAGEISWMRFQGYSTGWSDDTFRPWAPITREAMAAFLYRLAGRPMLQPKESFKDIPATHMFAKEIAWMKTSGISTGWDDGTFRPDQPVERGAIAAFLYRFCSVKSEVCAADIAPSKMNLTEPMVHFKDVNDSTMFAKEINWMSWARLTNGWSDATFRPTDSIQRAAMAAFTYRMTHNHR